MLGIIVQISSYTKSKSLVSLIGRKGIRAEVIFLFATYSLCVDGHETWKECVENDLKRLNLDRSMGADHESWRWLVRRSV